MIHSTAIDTTDELEEALEPMNNDELQEIKKKSISGAASYFIRTLFLNGIGLVTAFILSGYLSPEDFGVYGYVTQFIGLLVFFSDIGLAASLVQKKEEPSTRDYRTAFTVQQILSWLIFVIVVAICLSGIVQAKVGSVGIWVLLSLGISFPLASFKTISSIMLERRLDFSKLVLPQIAEQIVFNVILVWMVLQGYGVVSYSYAILVRSLVGAIYMFYLQPWSMGIAFDKKSLKEQLNFGAKFQLNDFLARMKDQLFFLVIAWFLPLKEFGYIQWAKNWSMYPYNLTVQNVMAITFPTFSRLQHNKDALRKAIEKSLFFITLAIFPIIVGMSVFIYPLTQAISKYGKWEPAILSFVLFSMGIAWSALSSPLTNTLNAIGEVGTTLSLMIMWTILTWILTPICMYYFGFHGVAIAAFIISFTSIIPVYYVKKIVMIDVWQNIWRQLFSSGVMAGFGILLMNVWVQNLQYLFMGMGLSAVVYGVSLLVIGKQKLLAEIKSLRK